MRGRYVANSPISGLAFGLRPRSDAPPWPTPAYNFLSGTFSRAAPPLRRNDFWIGVYRLRSAWDADHSPLYLRVCIIDSFPGRRRNPVFHPAMPVDPNSGNSGQLA